jgi:hypothetical protein
VLGDEGVCLDIVPSDADTGRQLILLGVLSQAGAGILLEILRIRLDEDSTMTLELYAVFVNDKLLGISTSCNYDAVTR